VAAAVAVEALIAGPTAVERSGSPAISGGLPESTKLLALTIEDGVARVDLSAEIGSVGGTFGELAVLAQLTYTLTQFSSVDEVLLLIAGEQVQYYGGHGFDVTPSLTRETFVVNEGMLGAVLIDSPAWWAQAASPVTVRGVARVFEGTIQFALYNSDGLPLAEGFTTTSEGRPRSAASSSRSPTRSMCRSSVR
jgi:hypothetical protein